MRRPLLLTCTALAVCLLAPDRTSAEIRLCNNNLASATCGNVCDSNGDGLIYFSLSRDDPDGAGPRLSLSDKVSTAMCGQFKYQATLPDGTPNPQTCAQFADEQIARLIREHVTHWLREQDAVGADSRLAADPVPEIE